MAEKLSVAIELAGAAEIARQLEDIGKTGAKAFEDISKAAEKVGGFDKLAPEQVTASLKKMGVEGVDAVKKIQTAVQATARLEGVVNGVRAVEGAFGRLHGVGAGALNTLGTAATKLGESLTRSLGPLAGAARALGPIGIAAGAVAGGSAALIKFAIAAEETEKSLSQLQKVTGQSFSELSTIANVFAQGGTGLKQFASEFGNLAEKIAAAKQAKQMRDAGKEAVDWANDVDQVRRKFDNLAEGIGATFSPLTTMNTKVQAVLESLAKITDPTKQQGKLAEIFKNLGSDLERAALGKALGLSPENIATLSLGAKKLQEMTDEAERLGLALDDVNKQSLKDLTMRQREASSLFTQLKDKMGALVAPAVASFWKGFSDQIKALIPEFLRMAQLFGEMDFTELGRSAANLLMWIGRIVVGLAALATGEVTFAQVGAEAMRLLTALVAEFAAALLTIAWNAITSGATTAWDWVKQKVAEAKQAVLDFGASLPGIAWDAITAGATAAWDTIVQGAAEAKAAVLDFADALPGIVWDAAIAGIQTLIDKVKELFGLRPAGGGGGAPAPALARGGLLSGRGTGTSDSNLAWLSRGEYIMPARAVAQPGVLGFLEALRRSGHIPGFAQGGFAAGGSVGFVRAQSVEQIVQAINSLAQSIAGAFQQVARQDTLTQGIDQILQAIGGARGKASGGLLGGRGTGTSDSNLAWVSRGEHIMPARAVRQPGVLAFLEALRRSGGNLADVLDGMGRFALGGMVPRAMPAFATGGLAGGMSHVTIQFPGLPAISGLRASSDVVDQLHKAAALAQVRSGGRKPSRYS